MTTPNLQILLKQAFDHEISNIHTALPGVIVKYDDALQKAEVKPSIQKKYYNGKVTGMPIITNVPIVFSRSKDSFFKFPLKAGDGVLLIFSERSLERWLSVGGIVEPGSNRKFDITDCIAIPGLFSFAEPAPETGNNLVVQHKNGQFVINENNKIAFGNNDEELLSIINDFLGDIKSITYGGNPLDPAGVILINNLKTRLDKIKGVLN